MTLDRTKAPGLTDGNYLPNVAPGSVAPLPRLAQPSLKQNRIPLPNSRPSTPKSSSPAVAPISPSKNRGINETVTSTGPAGRVLQTGRRKLPASGNNDDCLGQILRTVIHSAPPASIQEVLRDPATLEAILGNTEYWRLLEYIPTILKRQTKQFLKELQPRELLGWLVEVKGLDSQQGDRFDTLLKSVVQHSLATRGPLEYISPNKDVEMADPPPPEQRPSQIAQNPPGSIPGHNIIPNGRESFAIPSRGTYRQWYAKNKAVSIPSRQQSYLHLSSNGVKAPSFPPCMRQPRLSDESRTLQTPVREEAMLQTRVSAIDPTISPHGPALWLQSFKIQSSAGVGDKIPPQASPPTKAYWKVTKQSNGEPNQFVFRAGSKVRAGQMVRCCRGCGLPGHNARTCESNPL